MSEEKFVKDLSVVDKFQALQKQCNETYQEYRVIRQRNREIATAVERLYEDIGGIDDKGIDSDKKNINITIDLENKEFIKLRDSMISELGKLANYFLSEPLSVCLLYNYTLLATYYSFKGYIPKLRYYMKVIGKNYKDKYFTPDHNFHKCCNWCEVETKSLEWIFSHDDLDKILEVEFVYYNTKPVLYSLFPNVEYKTITTLILFNIVTEPKSTGSECIVDLYYKPILADKQ
jgi:hypothetical protein